MNHELPVVDSCDNCGACCLEQESPPGYVLLLNSPGIRENPGKFGDDVERLESIPNEAAAELRDYLAALLAGEQRSDPACIWLNKATMRCRYHEHRPSICRDFEIGSAECIEWRRDYRIDP
jgi:Fe-S-cluster containining protein